MIREAGFIQRRKADAGRERAPYVPDERLAVKD
jgi:hypothetical protein